MYISRNSGWQESQGVSELEVMWKEVVITYFDELFQNACDGTEKNRENYQLNPTESNPHIHTLSLRSI